MFARFALYSFRVCLLFVFWFPSITLAESSKTLEISRPVRSWEFLPVVGTRAGIFGTEAGDLEAWVYPLKLFRNFHLKFLTNGQELPAESLARTLIVRPESATIVYSENTFTVRETIFVPLDEAGAVIQIEVETADPLEIEAVFNRDFQLEWPAALGGTFLFWDPALHAFHLGEEQKKYVALVGSPSGTQNRLEYATNYSSSNQNSFGLGVTEKGSAVKTIVIAASTHGQAEAEKIYRDLEANYPRLLKESAEYYQKYLENTVQLELPDPQIQQAYDWSRVSMLQGLVNNPELGTGLIAGYRTSFGTQRPGFAWFFGRDSVWTCLALDASGDFSTTKTALEFLAKYQRADGKVPHEVSQAADLVPWFTNYPYGFASADATPLFIIGLNDYVVHSGDIAFAKDEWDNLWRAYQFLKSTYDPQGFPQNFGFGHGWVEGGPLLPVKSELYQAGVGAEALRALANLAKLTGKDDVISQLSQEFSQHQNMINRTFWSDEKHTYVFALDANSQRVEIPTVLSTVPMWFGLLEKEKTSKTIGQLAAADHQTDWGMRIISSQNPNYNPGGYHYGSVWPLFTGWASVGEYRYHEAAPAYLNLRANALLALDGSPGHTTEVLSGAYYQPLSTSSPHQIWSAAMVVSPLLRGMLGLEVDSVNRRVTFAPHLPADWNFVKVRGIRVADSTLDLTYRKNAGGITLEIQRSGTGEVDFSFAPSLSPRARILDARLNNNRRMESRKENNGNDQHAQIGLEINQPHTTLQIRTRQDFGISINAQLPPLGSESKGARIVSEAWSSGNSLLTLQIEGVPGETYKLKTWNAEQISSVDGGKVSSQDGHLLVDFPASSSKAYTRQQVTIHFVK